MQEHRRTNGSPKFEGPLRHTLKPAPSDDALVRDQIRLRSSIEAALGGILAINGDGRIVFMNGHTEEMFGYLRREILGQSLMALIPERLHEDFGTALQAYFAAPSVRLLGMEMGLAGQRKNGEEFPVEIGLSFVEGQDGLIALGFVTDVTDRKQMGDELSRINSELLRSHTELDHLAHLVSHDLQEPLRVISSYLDLLDRRYHGRLGGEAQAFIGHVLDGASRMKLQIQNLVTFFGVDTVAPAVHLVPGALIVETAVENLRVAIGQRSAQITWDALPEIVADRGLLTQVIQNLISNGITFNKDRVPRVHIAATQQDSEWVFSIRDNGVGMQGHDSEDIFKMFERVDSNGEYPRTGLGLMIARKIVESHLGRIWFESKPGEGTIFFFSLPTAPMAVSQTTAD